MGKRTGSSSTAPADSNIATADMDIEVIIQKVMDVVRAELRKIMEEYQSRVKELSDSLNDVTERLLSLEDRVSKLKPTESTSVNHESEWQALTKACQEAKLAASDNEQYSRRNNLRIRGISRPFAATSSSNDCKDTVVQFFRSKLNLQNIKATDIEAAHVVPSRVDISQQQREPVILVKFKEKQVRDTVIRQRKLLKGTRCTIVEDLTTLNVEAMNRARKHADVDKIWSWNGRIYAILKSGTKILVKPFLPIQDCQVLDIE